MGEYLRSTRECTLESFQPQLTAAIHRHIERFELGDILESILMCCETTSTKQKKGLFNRKAEVILSSVVITAKWLIWASGKEEETPGVLSARLHDIRVQDYEKSDYYKMIPDTGLNVFGFATGDGPGSVFIGLGPEPAAQRFRTVLKDAVAQA